MMSHVYQPSVFQASQCRGFCATKHDEPKHLLAPPHRTYNRFAEHHLNLNCHQSLNNWLQPQPLSLHPNLPPHTRNPIRLCLSRLERIVSTLRVTHPLSYTLGPNALAAALMIMRCDAGLHARMLTHALLACTLRLTLPPAQRHRLHLAVPQRPCGSLIQRLIHSSKPRRDRREVVCRAVLRHRASMETGCARHAEPCDDSELCRRQRLAAGDGCCLSYVDVCVSCCLVWRCCCGGVCVFVEHAARVADARALV